MLDKELTEERKLSHEQAVEEALPECPFYKKIRRYAVVCEGPEDQTDTQVYFKTAEQKRAYMDRFCYCMNFDKCVIAKALYAKYE